MKKKSMKNEKKKEKKGAAGWVGLLPNRVTIHWEIVL